MHILSVYLLWGMIPASSENKHASVNYCLHQFIDVSQATHWGQSFGHKAWTIWTLYTCTWNCLCIILTTVLWGMWSSLCISSFETWWVYFWGLCWKVLWVALTVFSFTLDLPVIWRYCSNYSDSRFVVQTNTASPFKLSYQPSKLKHQMDLIHTSLKL